MCSMCASPLYETAFLSCVCAYNLTANPALLDRTCSPKISIPNLVVNPKASDISFFKPAPRQLYNYKRKLSTDKFGLLYRPSHPAPTNQNSLANLQPQTSSVIVSVGLQLIAALTGESCDQGVECLNLLLVGWLS